MEKFKKGDKVLVFNGAIKGQIVTIERKYSNITGYYELIYTIREDKNKYTHYYCSESNIIPLKGNELLSILYGVEED